MPNRPAQPCDIALIADHARGLGSPDVRVRVEAHVASCEACRADLAALVRLAAVTRADAVEVPGRAAMQRAFDIFAATSADSRLSLPRWLGALVGSAEPALAGLRADPAVGDRQGEFRAGPYTVRLRVDVDPRDTTCAIVGQVDGDAGRTVDGLPVLVTVGARVLQQAATNAHGEFECVCEALPQLRVQVVVEGGARRVELPLNRFLEDGAA
ncbi:zf-HC2 domain-containing protein [Luteitalea sp. TBR-22]|uniref:zf-HC2 domain-containing protein n=1 Tax=Luteitalea sp. TBR-22 TaxID=2802971 RepID=UPI001EF40F36|nr:zf-HC2 domain-containing protein [Luteitalea sp. TBR-22]